MRFRRFVTSCPWNRGLLLFSCSMTFLFLFYGSFTFRSTPSLQQEDQLDLWSGRRISTMPSSKGSKLRKEGANRHINSGFNSDSHENEEQRSSVPHLLTTQGTPLGNTANESKSESNPGIVIVWAKDGSHLTSTDPSTSNSLNRSKVRPPLTVASNASSLTGTLQSISSTSPLVTTATESFLSPDKSLDQRRQALKNQIQSLGFVVGSVAPVAANSTATIVQHVNRTVTKEDIKKTLDILTRRLNETRRQLKTEASQFMWNTEEPRILLIVTTWRSGSTFLGHILASHPGVFNHYEPLMHMGIKQVRLGPEVDDSVQLITQLTQCKYSHSQYLDRVAQNVGDMLGHNAHVWDSCLAGPNRLTCANATFLEQACKKFPYQTVKLVRLRLNLTDRLLVKLPRVKILYLVRDPRGTLNSRLSSVKWCAQSEDCIQPLRLCDDLSSDLDAFEKFVVKFPGRVALVKYETLATTPQRAFKAVFDFAGLQFTQQLQDMVVKHTSRNEDQPWSITRKSSERVDLWQQKLSPSKIKETETFCQTVIKRLGYKLTA